MSLGEDQPEPVSRSGGNGIAEAASAREPFRSVRPPRQEAAGLSRRSVREPARGHRRDPPGSSGFSEPV